jgi:hypothetical protein
MRVCDRRRPSLEGVVADRAPFSCDPEQAATEHELDRHLIREQGLAGLGRRADDPQPFRQQAGQRLPQRRDIEGQQVRSIQLPQVVLDGTSASLAIRATTRCERP